MEATDVLVHRHLWQSLMTLGPELPRRTNSVERLSSVGDSSAPVRSIGMEHAARPADGANEQGRALNLTLMDRAVTTILSSGAPRPLVSSAEFGPEALAAVERHAERRTEKNGRTGGPVAVSAERNDADSVARLDVVRRWLGQDSVP